MAHAYRHRFERTVGYRAEPAELFAFLDSSERLGAHMSKPSWMMLGGSMKYILDEAKGQRAGSVIRMEGSVAGLTLALEEVVIEYSPPHRKVWETRGTPRLLVIGQYRLGFEVSASGPSGSAAHVFIDYDLPGGPSWLLGALFGRTYARWCINSMAKAAALAFPVE